MFNPKFSTNFPISNAPKSWSFIACSFKLAIPSPWVNILASTSAMFNISSVLVLALTLCSTSASKGLKLFLTRPFFDASDAISSILDPLNLIGLAVALFHESNTHCLTNWFQTAWDSGLLGILTVLSTDPFFAKIS